MATETYEKDHPVLTFRHTDGAERAHAAVRPRAARALEKVVHSSPLAAP